MTEIITIIRLVLVAAAPKTLLKLDGITNVVMAAADEAVTSTAAGTAMAASATDVMAVVSIVCGALMVWVKAAFVIL